MYQKIFFALILLGSSVSYAKGGRPPRMSDEAKLAIEECGLSLPQRGERPSREEHEAIKSCLSEAGIAKPSRGDRQRGSRQRSDDSGSQSIQ